ncbi:MAG: hypothetical protein JOZ48_17855 [Acidobacteriaceae bacterium]|nr:hypothetical protein [Acidobacteriaceae bacterium]
MNTNRNHDGTNGPTGSGGPRETWPPDLIDRYLHTVGFWLPAALRRDVISELREDILEKIDERQSELDRNLTVAEVAAVLQQRGNPMLVAHGFLPRRPLIGDALLPAYWLSLKVIVLGILLPIYAFVVGPIMARSAPNLWVGCTQAIWQFAIAAVFSFGVITLVFACFERFPHPNLYQWDPRRLAPVPGDSADAEWRREPVAVTIAIMGLSLALGIAWITLMKGANAISYQGVRLELAPVWDTLFWPILAALWSGLLAGTIRLLRPDKPQLHAVGRLAIAGLSLMTLLVLIASPVLIESRGTPIDTDPDTAYWVQMGGRIALWALAAVVAFDGFSEARLLFRSKGAGPRSAGLQRVG